MFWGLILKANKKYTQTTKQAFHISQAALDVTSCADGPIQLFLTYENIKYLICTLRKNTAEQVMLDLNFNEGDEISLQSQGSGTIHISGYVTELNDPFDDLEEEESETEDQQVATKKSKKSNESKVNNSIKAAAAAAAAASKKVEATEEDDDDDDDEDDSDFNGEIGVAEGDSDDDEDGDEDDDDEEDDDDDDEDDDEEDESEDEEVQQPKAKQPKLEKPKQNGIEPQKKEGKQKKDKKDASQQQQQQQQAQKQKGGEHTLSGGVKVEDIRVGNGPEAKPGKRAQVYYEGRLKSNNKVFDSLKQGAPFKFGLGRGEVIKGWDIGVAGMKVGGKRRITCPPHMAYGARGSPPTIPPNSTLVFEVELKGVQ